MRTRSSLAYDLGADTGTEQLFYLAAGPAAAILLGMLLVPLREQTSASNLTFAFLVLTIAVGEFGGRWPALATAVASALSLNFFLTQPYLTLAIHRIDDVIAFAGLAVSGLLAAAFSTDRGRRLARLDRSRQQLRLLSDALSRLTPGEQLEAQLADTLRACRDALPVVGAVVRDRRGYVLASSDNASTLRSARDEPDAHIPLKVGARELGWLDVWGAGPPAGAERRTLADLGQLIALVLAAANQE